MSHEQTPHSIPFEVIDVRWANNAIRLDPGYSQQLFFHNGLSKPITVVYRSGITVTIAPTNDYKSPREFIIRSAWQATRSVFVDQQVLLSDPHDDWTTECQFIKDALLETSSSGFSRGGGIDYALKFSDFVNNQGSLYLHQFDLLVSTLPQEAIPLHPYSDRGVRGLMLSNDDAIMGKERFQYGVTIVDKQNRFGRKFINLAGEVFGITPVTDSELNDGVYFKTSGPVSEVGLTSKPRCVYLTFDQAKEKLNLYNSVEEAATLGNPKAIDDRLQRELSSEVRRQEHAMKLRQREREEELEEIRFTQERREALQRGLEANLRDERLIEEHRRALETLQRKDQYEERSLDRKTSTDLLKYAPALIAALGSLAVLFSKR